LITVYVLFTKDIENTMKAKPIYLSIFLSISFLATVGLVVCQEAVDTGHATTTEDPAIPVDQLNALVRPMEKKELIIEVEAWQELVKQKAQDVGLTEIKIKHQNEEIDKAEEIAEKTEDAKDAVESKEESKILLLDLLTQLRTERTALIDRMNVVLKELESKGGDIDEYRKYLNSVSNVQIEWFDLKSTLHSLKGWLKSKEGGMRWLKNISLFIATMVVFWILAGIAGFLMKKTFLHSKVFSKKLSVLIQEFLIKMVRRVVLLIGFIIALSALGFQLGPIMAVIGAAGFIVAFALQDSLGNLANGIMILLNRPFDVGDIVEVAGSSGKVHSMNLVSTTIKSFDNKIIIVPNNSVWGSVITNSTAAKIRRVDMVFGIGYSDNIEKAQKILEEILSKHDLVLKSPEYVVRVHELADSSVNFICRPWTNVSDYWTVYWDVTRSVKERFDKDGVSIPFPQRDIHMHQVTAE